ncbi:transcriptional regulator [Desulfosporosinus acidiphilus SJ4]|uniref:Transcriptional regulator n=1 Tax=Desulfosporosinus acidiphilus (strain DSM 22704 / JCM 16185 / SJ4) TaxID=646529 RepID=I4D242_DESAJ|nr:FadR/GntR family transcriptional regulator [Desulfosporosinus acidiphilus]AFM39866.1 transcriptional regulator [Desulfosporosinus acidiphilus SJ4]
MDNLNPIHIPENMLLLRRRLMLSQTEFIQKYFMNQDDNRPHLSISKLSSLEKRSSKDSEYYTSLLAQTFAVDPKLFQLPPDDFAKNIDVFLNPQHSVQEKALSYLTPIIRKPSQVETLANAISNFLEDQILAGALKPGDKLPSDRNLAIQFNVGRTSIREALKVLNVLGLINILPGQGTFIASDSSDFFMTPLSWTFFLGDKNMEHVISVRNVLEIESARLAAINATREDLHALKKIYQESKTAYEESNFQHFLNLDLDFHLSIAQCSHNPILCNLLQTSRKLIKHISKSGMLNLDNLNAVFKEHSLIYENIAKHNNEEAVLAMNNHLENAKIRYRVIHN